MDNQVKIFHPSGILDIDKGNSLRQEVVSAITTEDTDLFLIDLSNVSFMNSSGLGALVATYKSVKTANKNLFLCGLNDQVRMIFELTKMDLIFKIFKDVEDFKAQNFK